MVACISAESTQMLTEPGYTPLNLRALIERSGLTQAAAADMIGVNHKTLRRWLVEDLDSPAHSDMPLRKWRALMEKTNG